MGIEETNSGIMDRLSALTPRHNELVWLSAESSFLVEKGVRGVVGSLVWGIHGFVTLKWLQNAEEVEEGLESNDNHSNQFISSMGLGGPGTDNMDEVRELLHNFETTLAEPANEGEGGDELVERSEEDGQNGENQVNQETIYTPFGIPARLGEGKTQTFVRRAIGAEIRNPQTGKSKKVYCRNIEADSFADAIKIAARIKLRPVFVKEAQDEDEEEL